MGVTDLTFLFHGCAGINRPKCKMWRFDPALADSRENTPCWPNVAIGPRTPRLISDAASFRLHFVPKIVFLSKSKQLNEQYYMRTTHGFNLSAQNVIRAAKIGMLILWIALTGQRTEAIAIVANDKPANTREDGNLGRIQINVTPKLAKPGEDILVQVWLVKSEGFADRMPEEEEQEVIFNWSGTLDVRPELTLTNGTGRCIVKSAHLNEKIVLQAHVPGYGMNFETIRIRTTFPHTLGQIAIGSLVGLGLLVARFLLHEKSSRASVGVLAKRWGARVVISILTSFVAFIWSKTELPLGALPLQPSDDASLIMLGFITCYIGSDIILGPLSKELQKQG
jgi:hypothetical protein